MQPLAQEESNLLIAGSRSGFLCGFANSCAATMWGASEGQEMRGWRLPYAPCQVLVNSFLRSSAELHLRHTK